jgi:DnaJ homolog subfamily C member 19
MTALLIGALALVIFLLLARGYTRTDPRMLASGVRAAIILGAIVAGIALVASGRPAYAILPLAVLAAAFAQDKWRKQAGGGGGTRSSGDRDHPHPGHMTRAEAFKVLGLAEGASEEETLAAYRKLIMQNHPDKGGSTYLAAKINQAKDVLLGK